jgi:hypothetical protein
MADNDLADLNSQLATALRDTSYATWATGEMDDLVTLSVRQLWPRFARTLDPESTTITMVADDYYYSLPSGVVSVSRVDRYNSSGDDYGPIYSRAWELVGDALSGSGKIHFAQQLVVAGDVMHLHGYGRYDAVSNLIPDDLEPLVLAQARAEAYRRLAGDRQRFKAWLARNQTQNVSINELLQIINEADNEVVRLRALTPKTYQRPVPGRV